MNPIIDDSISSMVVSHFSECILKYHAIAIINYSLTCTVIRHSFHPLINQYLMFIPLCIVNYILSLVIWKYPIRCSHQLVRKHPWLSANDASTLQICNSVPLASYGTILLTQPPCVVILVVFFLTTHIVAVP